MDTIFNFRDRRPLPSPSSQAEQRDDALLLTISDALSAILVCDRSGRVLLANDRANTALGYEAGELIGRAFGTIVPDASFDIAGDSSPYSGTAYRKDRTPLPVTLAINAVPAGNDIRFVASLADRSEQRDLEARLECAERDAARRALISEAVMRCAAARFDRIDEAISRAVQDIGEAMAVDRCIAYLPGSRVTTLVPLYRWAREGEARPDDSFDACEELPWIVSQVRDGDTVSADAIANLPNEADRDALAALGVSSCAAMPLTFNGTRGLRLVDTAAPRAWSADALENLRLVAAVMAQTLARRHDRARLRSGLDDLTERTARTSHENAVLRREISTLRSDRTIAADSVAIRRVLDQVRQVAPTSATVLLLGETGVGKEVFAQAIHDASPRQRRPMIRVTCAAIPSALIESELFGRERGAFTGALSRQLGRFEAANGSTIFLDEIGDLPLEIQVKLLRVIQERTVERLGSNDPVKVDVRIIAATHRSLEQAVAAGAFREDLFYRLNVFPVTIPPLRERVEDIQGLVWTFIDEFSRAFGKRIDSISKESLAALQRYAWPGNVRELRNVIEREMIVATGPTLVVAPPRPLTSQRRTISSKLVDVEVEHIRSVLDGCGWRVRGAGGAADRLGVKPTTLESRMARLGIARERRETSLRAD